jgi:hypothetical protein
MRIRPLLALGTALLGLAPAGASGGTAAASKPEASVAADPPPAFVPRVHGGSGSETYRNAARSVG